MFLYPIGRNTQDGALVSDAGGGRGATERSGCLLRPLLAVESAEKFADFWGPGNESGTT